MNQDWKSPRSPAWNVHDYEIFENLGSFRTDRTPDLMVRWSLMWFPVGLTAVLVIMRSCGDYDVLVSTLVIPLSSTKISKVLSSSGAPWLPYKLKIGRRISPSWTFLDVTSCGYLAVSLNTEYHAFFEHVREMFHVFEHFFTELFTNIFLLWTEHFSRQVLVQKNGGQNMRGLDV